MFTENDVVCNIFCNVLLVYELDDSDIMQLLKILIIFLKKFTIHIFPLAGVRYHHVVDYKSINIIGPCLK